MAGFTENGFETRDYDSLVDQVQEEQKEGTQNPNLNFAPDSHLTGAVNTPLLTVVAELWEALQSTVNNLNPEVAEAVGLVNLAALNGTKKDKWTKTRVLAQVTLNPNAALPAGSVANLSGQRDIRFVSTEEVPAGVGGGTFEVWFEAEEPGKQLVPVGQLSEIAEPVLGWVGVFNDEAGIAGTEPEKDVEFRAKREASLNASGSSRPDAIKARLLNDAEGVIDCVGEDNPTAYYVDGMSPYSVRMTVRGGTDEDVAQVIFGHHAGGVKTSGTTSYTVQDSEGTDHIVRWRKTNATSFACSSVVVWFGDPDVDTVRDYIKEYIDSISIGGPISYDRVRNAFYNSGVVDRVISLQIGFAGGSLGILDLGLSGNQHVEVTDRDDLVIT